MSADRSNPPCIHDWNHVRECVDCGEAEVTDRVEDLILPEIANAVRKLAGCVLSLSAGGTRKPTELAHQVKVAMDEVLADLGDDDATRRAGNRRANQSKRHLPKALRQRKEPTP